MYNYKQLKVWKKSVYLPVDIYKAAAEFPKEEKFGLTSQMRRSAISIPSNIAEGAGRKSGKEFCHFLSNAHRASFELETPIIISQKHKLISVETGNELCNKLNEVQHMNFTL